MTTQYVPGVLFGEFAADIISTGILVHEYPDAKVELLRGVMILRNVPGPDNNPVAEKNAHGVYQFGMFNWSPQDEQWFCRVHV